ncbi:MAG: hypothetical protein QM765_06385 [Myxococcales bacterium]
MTGPATTVPCRERLSRLTRQQQAVAYLALAHALTDQARTAFLDGLGGFERARQCNEVVHSLTAQALRLEQGRVDIAAMRAFAELICESAGSRGWLPLLARAIGQAEQVARRAVQPGESRTIRASSPSRPS